MTSGVASLRQTSTRLHRFGRSQNGKARASGDARWTALGISPLFALSLNFRFIAYLIPNCLFAENVFSCPMAFLFLRICLFVWHCPIILPKVNGVKSLFRCSDYSNIKARIFLFSVDFRIAIKIYLYLNSAYAPFLACRKANISSEVKKMETKRNCYDARSLFRRFAPYESLFMGEKQSLETF